MTTTIEAPPPTTVERIREVMTSLGLNQVEMAVYLGVPHRTLVNWLQGQRNPGPAVVRLLDVLGTVRALAPGLHALLVPAKKGGK